jgi:hypothetical protein
MPVLQIKTGAANYLYCSKQSYSFYAACDGVPLEVSTAVGVEMTFIY